MRWAVCRCLRGALRSASRTASTKSASACSFQRGRSVFFRGLGSALPIASRTIRRCTPSFLATPMIVPIPNSYSRRISSNNSTLALQSNESPPFGQRPNQSTRSLEGGPKQTAELGQIRIPKSPNLEEPQIPVPAISWHLKSLRGVQPPPPGIRQTEIPAAGFRRSYSSVDLSRLAVNSQDETVLDHWRP